MVVGGKAVSRGRLLGYTSEYRGGPCQKPAKYYADVKFRSLINLKTFQAYHLPQPSSLPAGWFHLLQILLAFSPQFLVSNRIIGYSGFRY